MTEKNYWTRSVSRRTTLRVAAIGAGGLAGAALIGCGDDDDAGDGDGDGGGGATATATATAAATAAAASPPALDYDPDGTLRVAILSDQGTMDPQLLGGGNYYNDMTHFGRVLVNHPVSNDFVPHMANLEWVDNYEAIVLKLHPGIIDHEGFPYLAEDLVWSLQRSAERGDYADREDWHSSRVKFFKNLGVPEAVDDLTVRVPVLQPDNTIPGGAFWAVTNVTRRYIERVGDVEASKTPSGYGPYRFVSRDPDTEAHSTRYDDYFWDRTNRAGQKQGSWQTPEYGPWTPWHKDLEHYARPEPITRVAGLKAGEFDYVPQLDIELGKELENDEDVTVEFYPRGRGLNIQMSTHNPTTPNGDPNPFRDKRVRIAANLAVDRDNYIKTLLHGSERYSFGLGSRSFGFPLGKIEKEHFGYDENRAKQLMAEAGYADGFDVNFYHPSGFYAQSDAIVLIVQQDLAKVGIRANLVGLDRSSFFGALRKFDIDTYGMWLTGGTAWPASMAAYYPDDGFLNQSPNPESRVTELFEKSLGIFDPEELKEVLGEIWTEHYKQATYLFLHEPMLASAYNHRRVRWLPDGGKERYPRPPATWEFQVLKT